MVSLSRLLFPLLALGLLGACAPASDEPQSQGWITATAGADTDAGDDDDADADDDDDDDDDSSGPNSGSDNSDSDDSGDPTGDADSNGGDPSALPQFDGQVSVVASAADGLDLPRDLEFNPSAPDQLWVANAAFHGVVILFDPGTDQQSTEQRADTYGQHFMANVSSIAFGATGTFASCNESRGEWNVVPQPPDDFMGPTLWPSDLDVFAVVGQEYPPGALEGCHLDMLHQSPWCMGIAHDSGNAYWAFDGLNGHLVYYDFMTDHGPGGGDHSDGAIRRFPEATITRVPDVPSHMVIDPQSGWLYVADTGTGRVMRLDSDSGTFAANLPGDRDGIPEYSSYEGAAWETVVDGLGQPSGVALGNGVLFVGDRSTAEIIAFDLDGIELDRYATGATALAGLELGPQGRLWFTDARDNEVLVIR